MNLENFPTSETALRMMGSITGNDFYENSYVGKWIFQVMGMEMEDARQRIEELSLQAFPETATWGLIYHEQKYGLPGIGTLEERRKSIMKKIMTVLPFNPELLKESLSFILDIDKNSIIVEENVAPYTFRLIFNEQYEGNISVKEGREYVKKIKPSHLSLALKLVSNHYVVTLNTFELCNVNRIRLSPFNKPVIALRDGQTKRDGLATRAGYENGIPYPFDMAVLNRLVLEETNSIVIKPVTNIVNKNIVISYLTGVQHTAFLANNTDIRNRAINKMLFEERNNISSELINYIINENIVDADVNRVQYTAFLTNNTDIGNRLINKASLPNLDTCKVSSAYFILLNNHHHTRLGTRHFITFRPDNKISCNAVTKTELKNVSTVTSNVLTTNAPLRRNGRYRRDGTTYRDGRTAKYII